MSPAQKIPVIYLRSDHELPPRAFYATLSRIGASVTGRPARDVNKWAHRCHRVAKRADGHAERSRRGLNIECRRSATRSVFLIKGPFQPAS